MPKKFEGHGSGEVEVKPAKMLWWENCLLDREVGDIRLIVELFRSGMRGHLLPPARLSTDYAKRENLSFQILIKPQVIFDKTKMNNKGLMALKDLNWRE